MSTTQALLQEIKDTLAQAQKSHADTVAFVQQLHDDRAKADDTRTQGQKKTIQEMRGIVEKLDATVVRLEKVAKGM